MFLAITCFIIQVYSLIKRRENMTNMLVLRETTEQTSTMSQSSSFIRPSTTKLSMSSSSFKCFNRSRSDSEKQSFNYNEKTKMLKVLQTARYWLIHIHDVLDSSNVNHGCADLHYLLDSPSHVQCSSIIPDDSNTTVWLPQASQDNFQPTCIF